MPVENLEELHKHRRERKAHQRGVSLKNHAVIECYDFFPGEDSFQTTAAAFHHARVEPGIADDVIRWFAES